MCGSARGLVWAALLAVSLIFPPQVRAAELRREAGNGDQGIAPVTPEQTLFIDDSITLKWTDEPVRAAYSSGEACTIGLHLATALAGRSATLTQTLCSSAMRL
jgi:hypothetical protein